MAHVIRLGLASPGAAGISRRRAVKAVAVQGGLLLMIRSGLAGDFKFPGGGVDASETDEQALTREIGEECGSEIRWMGEAVLELVETRPDTVHEGVDFQMVSVYFPCAVEPASRPQDLDDYELDLGMTAVWVDAAAAIAVNEVILSTGNAAPWVERETVVLRWLVDTGWLERLGSARA